MFFNMYTVLSDIFVTGLHLDSKLQNGQIILQTTLSVGVKITEIIVC